VVPFGPPSCSRVGVIAIIVVAVEEMDVVFAGDGGIATDVGGVGGAGKVDLKEVPARSKGAGVEVGDEE